MCESELGWYQVSFYIQITKQRSHNEVLCVLMPSVNELLSLSVIYLGRRVVLDAAGPLADFLPSPTKAVHD